MCVCVVRMGGQGGGGERKNSVRRLRAKQGSAGNEGLLWTGAMHPYTSSLVALRAAHQKSDIRENTATNTDK